MKKFWALCLAFVLLLSGCSAKGNRTEDQKWDSMERTGSMELTYADQFAVDYYGDFSLITIGEDEQEILLVPEGKEAPADVPDGITVLQQPLDHTYLVSSSVMDYIIRIDALSDIAFSGTKESDWSLPEAREAMESGSIKYAGKYSAPDYEEIVGDGCNLAIENTMIYHNPEVKEKLEQLGIPVLVERSSYESDPLGRLEWIKLYGLLFGKEKAADDFFDAQIKELTPLLHEEKTGKTVAFFAVTQNGSVTVRKPGDYVSNMIGLAGGQYIFTSLPGDDENALSTMNMQFEDFYTGAKDADILIYNSTIEGEISSIQDLLNKNSLFADFKAVKDGEVYCAQADFYQQPTGTGAFIEDLHKVMKGEDEDLTYLNHVE